MKRVNELSQDKVMIRDHLVIVLRVDHQSIVKSLRNHLEREEALGRSS